MSDRQSKNYDEATKRLLSGVANRTRSKRHCTYYGTSGDEEEDAHGISSRSQNVEATEISAPIPRRKQSSSRFNNRTASEGLSAPYDCRRQKKRRRIQLKSTRRVSPGKNNRGMDFEETDIERIDVAELKRKKTCFAPKMEFSTRQKLDGGFSVGSSRKNVDRMRDTGSPNLRRCFSSKDVRHGSDQGFFLQRGNNSGRPGKEVEIENRGRVEFSKKKNQSMSNMGPSTRNVIYDRFAASTSKNVYGVGKIMRCGSFSPENDKLHFNQAWRNQSTSILRNASARTIHCNEDMDSDDDVEQIEEAEFMNPKKHFTPKSINKGYVATSMDIRSASKNTSCADCCEPCCPNHTCPCADQLWPQESGSDSDDMVPEEFGFKETSRAKFGHQKTHFLRKTGGCFDASSSKYVVGTSKNTSYDDMCLSYSPEDSEETDTDPLLDMSTPLVNEGNKNECTSSEENILEYLDEAEFRRSLLRSASKIGYSTKQEVDETYLATDSRKNASAKDAMSDKRYRSFSSQKNAGRSSYKGQTDKSISSAKKGNKNECTSSEENILEYLDEAEFRRSILRSASKIGSSTKQEVDETYLATNSRKNASAKDTMSDKRYRSFSSQKNAGRSSYKGQIDKSISSAKKGKENDNIRPEEIEIKEIDESEFKNTRTSRENASSMRQKKPSAKNVDKKKNKTTVAARPRRTEGDDDNTDSSSFENSSSYSSSYSSSEDTSDYLQDDKITSVNEGRKINIGVAGRTRSKTGVINKPSKVDDVSLNSSNDSDSSTDSVSSDDEDLESESSFNSDDIERLPGKPAEVQENTSPNVSVEKSEESRKQERHVVNRDASKSGHLSDMQKEENRTAGDDVNAGEASGQKKNEKRERLPGKPAEVQENILPNVSVEKSEESRKQERHVVNRDASKSGHLSDMQKEENRTAGDDVNAGEASGQKKNKKRDNTVKVTYSKQRLAVKVNELPTKDPPQADISKQRNEVSPPQSKDHCDYIHSDDIEENFDATSSEFHVQNETENVEVAGEVKKPTEKKRVSSKRADYCTMIADSVLGTGPMLGTEASDEAAQKKAPASQTEGTLPLRFRFEDEVPKEVEKTEFQLEMEGLFNELDFGWAVQEVGSFFPEVDQEDENSPAEETQHARCTKGKHELILEDDIGVFCKYCYHVAIGPKDVLPEMVEKIYKESERKRDSELRHLPNFDGIHLQSSLDNFADVGSSSSTGTVWSTIPGIRESLYEHQQEGFEFLWKNLGGSINLNELKSSNPGQVGGCIISHAPGTGKTRLTVVFLESYLKLFPNCRPMIIAPAGMLLTWEEEFRKWNVEFPFFNLNSMELSGNENEIVAGVLEGRRRGNHEVIRWVKIHAWNKGRSVLGISYCLFEKLTGEKHLKNKKGETVPIDTQLSKYRKIFLEKPGLVVLDEGHYPRNNRSNIWNALLKLQSEKRVILSGTPFQNNFAELFNTLHLVRPAVADVLANEKTFSEMVAPKRNQRLNSEVVDRAVDKLKAYMSPFVHVHRGHILKQSLPGLRDCVVLLKPPPLQKSLIERLEGQQSTFEFEHKVAMISVHPYLFQHLESTEEQKNGIDMAAVEASKLNPNEGVKTKFIMDFVGLSMAKNEKVLIFSQYIDPLGLIMDQLKERFKWRVGKQILQMRGKLEQKQRQILINLFNDPLSESKVMLASTKCCSEGISLVGASRVILLDVVWNPSVERQAISRAYRIGQKKFVYTYHLMTSGTTEADKYCRQAEKDRLSELVFSSSNENEKKEHPSLGIEDGILEEMVGHTSLKEMFEKIINQPKDSDLIQTFGLPS